MSNANSNPDLREKARHWQAKRRERLIGDGRTHVTTALPADCLAFLDQLPRVGVKRGSRPVAIENAVRAVMSAVEDGRIKMEELTICKP